MIYGDDSTAVPAATSFNADRRLTRRVFLIMFPWRYLFFIIRRRSGSPTGSIENTSPLPFGRNIGSGGKMSAKMDNSDKAEICQGLYYKEIIFSIIINDYKQRPLKCKANQNCILFNIIILLINFTREVFSVTPDLRRRIDNSALCNPNWKIFYSGFFPLLPLLHSSIMRPDKSHRENLLTCMRHFDAN